MRGALGVRSSPRARIKKIGGLVVRAPPEGEVKFCYEILLGGAGERARAKSG